ncbi:MULTISPECIES: hypothetical protein [unclassified Streptomyces]|uniref:hypothetical protein n=1 Tax=unclassified Streptomyces TaxID=2593676 RepID=UPI0016618D4E|nr:MULTISPECIES: hypothetical protein [unclassified Streptomyces]MBD0839593.1 hypothetical protein [Streptomyces sp. TRM68416]
MSEFVQQLPALIGVVIGALGSYLALVRSDKARFGREQAARWEERRLAVYADYARSVKKTVTVTYRVAAHLGCGTHPDPLPLEEAKPLLAGANDGRDPSGEALLMLGSVAVVDEARAWVVTVMEMERFVREGRRDPEAWQALLARQRAGREGYYTAVREDLGLPPGHSARWRLPVTDPASSQR